MKPLWKVTFLVSHFNLNLVIGNVRELGSTNLFHHDIDRIDQYMFLSRYTNSSSWFDREHFLVHLCVKGENRSTVLLVSCRELQDKGLSSFEVLCMLLVFSEMVYHSFTHGKYCER